MTTLETTRADEMQPEGMKNFVTGMIETRFGEGPGRRKRRISRQFRCFSSDLRS